MFTLHSGVRVLQLQSARIVNFDSAESCSPLFQQERLPQVMPSFTISPRSRTWSSAFTYPLLMEQQPFILQPTRRTTLQQVTSAVNRVFPKLPEARKVESYYFLTNVDVQGSDLLGAVVTLGASITEGLISTEDANHRWPDFIASRFVDAGLKIGVLNQGISGTVCSRMERDRARWLASNVTCWTNRVSAG